MSSQFYTPNYYRRPKKMGSYFLPFFSIIVLGLIVIFVFLIFSYFRDRQVKALENKAAVKIVTGTAEMKIWQYDEWSKAVDGTILKEGDALRTFPGSRVILTLLNGSMVRLGSDTEVELTTLKTRDAHDELWLTLKKGQTWIKKTTDESVRASLTVSTKHLEVSSIGTIFDVTDIQKESVHVLDGKVRVVLKVEDSEKDEPRVADTVEVALGQEVTIGADEITQLKARKPVDLLALLSDEFRGSEWYRWNRGEDTTGSNGVSVADALDLANTSPPPPPPVAPEPPPVELSILPAPVILTPQEEARTTSANSIAITGTTDPKTEKIEIASKSTNADGTEKSDVYVLSKYKAGNKQWSYVASPAYSNLFPGANILSVTAIGKDGKRSDPAVITITYNPPVLPPPAEITPPPAE